MDNDYGVNPIISEFSPRISRKPNITPNDSVESNELNNTQIIGEISKELRMTQMKADNQQKEKIIKELHVHVEGLLRFKKESLRQSKFISELEKKLVEKNSQLTHASRTLSTLKNESVEFGSQFEELLKEREESRTKIIELNEKLQKILGESKKSEANKENLELQVEKLNSQIQETQRLQSQSEREQSDMIEMLKIRLAEAEREKKGTEKEVSTARKKILSLDSAVQKSREDTESVRREKVRLEAELSDLTRENEELRKGVEKLTHERGKIPILEQTYENLKNEMTECGKVLKEQQKINKKLMDENQNLKVGTHELENRVMATTQQKENIEREASVLKQYERIAREKSQYIEQLQRRIDQMQQLMEEDTTESAKKWKEQERQSNVVQDNLTKLFKMFNTREEADLEPLDEKFSTLGPMNNILLMSFKEKIVTLTRELDYYKERVKKLEHRRNTQSTEEESERKKLATELEYFRDTLGKTEVELEKVKREKAEREGKLVRELTDTKKILFPLYRSLKTELNTSLFDLDEKEEDVSWEKLKKGFEKRTLDMLSQLKEARREAESLKSEIFNERELEMKLGEQRKNFDRIKESFEKELQLKDLQCQTKIEMQEGRLLEERSRGENERHVLQKRLSEKENEIQGLEKTVGELLEGLNSVESRLKGVRALEDIVKVMRKNENTFIDEMKRILQMLKVDETVQDELLGRYERIGKNVDEIIERVEGKETEDKDKTKEEESELLLKMGDLEMSCGLVSKLLGEVASRVEMNERENQLKTGENNDRIGNLISKNNDLEVAVREKDALLETLGSEKRKLETELKAVQDVHSGAIEELRAKSERLLDLEARELETRTMGQKMENVVRDNSLLIKEMKTKSERIVLLEGKLKEMRDIRTTLEIKIAECSALIHELEGKTNRIIELENSKKKYKAMVKDLNEKYVMSNDSRYLDSDDEGGGGGAEEIMTMRGNGNGNETEMVDRFEPELPRRKVPEPTPRTNRININNTKSKSSFAASNLDTSLYPLLHDLETSEVMVEKLSRQNRKTTSEMKKLDRNLNMVRRNVDVLLANERNNQSKNISRSRSRVFGNGFDFSEMLHEK